MEGMTTHFKFVSCNYRGGRYAGRFATVKNPESRPTMVNTL